MPSFANYIDMPNFANIDWHKLLVPDQSILDVVIRGTIVYLMLFVVLRFFLKRRLGGLGIADDLASRARGSLNRRQPIASFSVVQRYVGFLGQTGSRWHMLEMTLLTHLRRTTDRISAVQRAPAARWCAIV
jgi:hypothetical protein